MYWYVKFERQTVLVWQYSFSLYSLPQKNCVLKVTNMVCMCGHMKESKNLEAENLTEALVVFLTHFRLMLGQYCAVCKKRALVNRPDLNILAYMSNVLASPFPCLPTTFIPSMRCVPGSQATACGDLISGGCLQVLISVFSKTVLVYHLLPGKQLVRILSTKVSSIMPM
jgi:hypothetical protein